MCRTGRAPLSLPLPCPAWTTLRVWCGARLRLLRLSSPSRQHLSMLPLTGSASSLGWCRRARFVAAQLTDMPAWQADAR